MADRRKIKAPKAELISEKEYEKTMKRLMDIQIAADAAAKAINNLKSTLATFNF